MSELTRKINAAKWRQVELKKGVDVSADAITSCLKTRDNELSFWEIPSGEKIDQAALAIVASGQRLETFDVVQLSYEEVEKSGLEPVKSDGNTKVENLVKTHFDLIKLSYSKLGIIASHIVDSLISKKYKRYTKDQLRTLLNNAITDGILKKEDLPESISKEL